MYGAIQTLTTLDLAGNEIGDVGAQHFAHALEQNAVRLVAQLHIQYKFAVFDTDTYPIRSLELQNRHCRNNIFSECISTKQGSHSYRFTYFIRIGNS